MNDAEPVTLLTGPVPDADQALEVAVATALVRRAGSGEVGETLRIYRPTRPAVVFGRREVRLPGFPAAAAAARTGGFEPVIRATGGRAVAYTDRALVIDHVRTERGAGIRQERRFQEYGALFVDVFRGLGIAAGLGAVPGEYCPGAHSINARRTSKLVGTAQRVVRDSWLFSALVVVGDEDRLRPVLAEVYRALGEPFDPQSVGSLSAERRSVSEAEVEALLIEAYLGGREARTGGVEEATLALAVELAETHRVPRPTVTGPGS